MPEWLGPYIGTTSAIRAEMDDARKE